MVEWSNLLYSLRFIDPNRAAGQCMQSHHPLIMDAIELSECLWVSTALSF